MGTAQTMNVMDVWAERDRIKAEEHAKTIVSTLEVLELIDPPKKRIVNRSQRRAMQSEVDAARAKVKGLIMKSNAMIEEMKRRAEQI